MSNKVKSVVFFTMLLVAGCEGKKGNGAHNDAQPDGGNQALYDEVMKVHDEVMPKMDDIYKLREKLKRRIANVPTMQEEKKKQLESVIVELDEASEGMMVWMRNFNPLPDSLGEEKARQYLEDQKEKVNKVRQDMLEALDQAKALDPG